MVHGLGGLILLALAVSLDGFGAGVSYGLRRIRLDWRSLAVVGLVAGATAWLATGTGHLFAHLAGRQWGGAFVQQLGAALLLGLGLVSLNNAGREQSGSQVGQAADVPAANHPPGGRRRLWCLHLRTWGLVVEVARQPGRADLDRSGSISLPEALLLGLALALDSGGVGLGAGMAGFPPVGVALTVAPINVALLWLGTWLGRRTSGEGRRGWLAWGPGVILLALAVARMRG
ncbi:MAG TPA: hypothetical protein GXX28_08970 [Firmicutes bacterium]|nr:hypothetical protein [Bacillota bacterium]